MGLEAGEEGFSQNSRSVVLGCLDMLQGLMGHCTLREKEREEVSPLYVYVNGRRGNKKAKPRPQPGSLNCEHVKR